MSAEGRAVLITGGGSGIGRATAIEIARGGGMVAAVDRDGDAASETAAIIERAGGRAVSVASDVSDEDAVAHAVARSLGAFHRLDGVVTCAGIFHGPDLAPLAEVDLETFHRVLDVNLVGTFLTLKHALPHLVRDEGEVTSAIVTIASTAAIRGHGMGPAYTASKGGVTALTRLVAVQYGPLGVRANCICPGGVDTPMAAGAWNTDEARTRLRRTVPLGRIADARDIAEAAAFFVSDGARHVTGQTLTIDGGATIA